MGKPGTPSPETSEIVHERILFIRGKRVMLSDDLAQFYGLEPRALIQAVKRNLNRFPADFMFQLSKDEAINLKSQIVISSWGGSRRATPYAFTQEGVAMLSGVLRSPRAVRVNIAIMRAFVHLREVLAIHKDLARKLEKLEGKVGSHDAKFEAVFDAIRQLMKEPERPKRQIGFTVREKGVTYKS